MTPTSLRSVLRWFHIAVALVLGAYIYSPLRDDPAWSGIVRFGVLPLAVVTGLWLRKQKRVAELFGAGSPENGA